MNLALFTPEISLVGFAALVIILDLFIERKGWLVAVSILGLVVTAVLAALLWGG